MPRFYPSLTPLEDRATPTTLPAGFAETALATGLTKASALAVAPDGRVFVAEQGGALRVIRDGALNPTLAVSLTTDSQGERGLIGVTLAPDFPMTGNVYLYYTVPAAGGAAPFNRVSRFTLAGDAVVPGSERVIVNLDPLSSATNHNGGGLRFGADGKLYVAVGENASPANSQSPNTRLGKLLRLNPDGTIPADNPATISGIGPTSGANRAIFAAGLRNPFAFDIQPGTGEIFINDVGQSAFEEIDRGRAGANYGWPATEGDFDPAAFPAFDRPIVNYPHGDGSPAVGRSITAGVFYNPATAAFPADYAGDYFYTDLLGKWINRRDAATGAVTNFATGTAASPTGLAVTPRGDLLYLSYGTTPGTAAVYQVHFTPPVSPPLPQPPVPPPPASPPTPGRALAALGAGAGGGPVVVVADPSTGSQVTRFFAFEPAFTGGVSVASADVTGDAIPDVIAGAGSGGGPRVRVFDGATGQPIQDFFAFEPTFTGGVTVRAADFTGDGRADQVIAADQGGGPRVRIIDGRTGATVADFFAFEATFTGGVRTAAADITGDGVPDLTVAAGPGGGPRVARFDGQSLRANRPTRLGGDVFVFDPALRSGATVAAGDLDGDGVADTAYGSGPGGSPRVQVVSGRTNAPLADFFAGDPADRGGANVAVSGGRLVVGQAGRATAYQLAAGTAPRGTPLPGFDGFLGGVSVG